MKGSSKGDLRISYEGVDDRQAAYIALLLAEEQYRVEALDLSYNFIGDEGCAALAGGLEWHQSLRVLDLKKNQIGISGFLTLVTSLTASGHSLLHLNLFDKPVFSVTAGPECERLPSMLRRLISTSSLHVLSLGRTGLGYRECEAISTALSQHGSTQLILLQLSHNKIGDEGVVVLCHGLATNITLKYMDLSYNLISSEGAQAMRHCLEFRVQQGFSLERVWMGGNPAGRDCLSGCMMNSVFPDFLSVTDAIKFCTQ